MVTCRYWLQIRVSYYTNYVGVRWEGIIFSFMIVRDAGMGVGMRTKIGGGDGKGEGESAWSLWRTLYFEIFLLGDRDPLDWIRRISCPNPVGQWWPKDCWAVLGAPHVYKYHLVFVYNLHRESAPSNILMIKDTQQESLYTSLPVYLLSTSYPCPMRRPHLRRTESADIRDSSPPAPPEKGGSYIPSSNRSSSKQSVKCPSSRGLLQEIKVLDTPHMLYSLLSPQWQLEPEAVTLKRTKLCREWYWRIVVTAAPKHPSGTSSSWRTLHGGHGCDLSGHEGEKPASSPRTEWK